MSGTLKKTVKIGGKAVKVLVIVTVINDVATEGVVVAAENAGRDMLWPLPEIGEKAGKVIDKYTDHGIANRRDRETYYAPPLDEPLSPRSYYPWMNKSTQ